MESIEVGAEPGWGPPFGSPFDSGPLTPFVEGRDELPCLARRAHVSDIGFEGRDIAREPCGPLIGPPEARTDGKRAADVLLPRGRPVLVPTLRLCGAGGIARKDLEVDVGSTDIGCLPLVSHRAGRVICVVDEDGERPPGGWVRTIR